MASINFREFLPSLLSHRRRAGRFILVWVMTLAAGGSVRADEFAILLAAEELSLDLPASKTKSVPSQEPPSQHATETKNLELKDLATQDLATQPLETDESTGSLADQLKEDAARLEVRLAALQKPAHQLTLVPDFLDSEDSIEPVNQAAAVLVSVPPRRVSAQWQPILKAERDHVPFCHRPTYFQELNLERCGLTDCESMGCLQNAYSSLWFLTNAALLPYRSVTQSPYACVPAYGDRTTCQESPLPIEPLGCQRGPSHCPRGALMQAASMAGPRVPQGKSPGGR